MVLESSGEAAVAMMMKLLKVLWETGLVTLDQMNRVGTGGGGALGKSTLAGLIMETATKGGHNPLQYPTGQTGLGATRRDL